MRSFTSVARGEHQDRHPALALGAAPRRPRSRPCRAASRRARPRRSRSELRLREGLVAGDGEVDRIALAGQPALQRASQLHVVFDNEQSHLEYSVGACADRLALSCKLGLTTQEIAPCECAEEV